MKPPFAYYGGKILLAPKIVHEMETIPHGNYVEPFCGGASVLFAKDRPEVTSARSYREVINDADSRIVNFYRVMQNARTAGRLIRMLEHTPYSREEYYRAIDILASEETDPVVRAWATFTVIEQSFGRQLGRAGWSKTIGGANSRQPPQTWRAKTTREKLRAVWERLELVYVTNTDALKCIEDFDTPRTCFYVDPPYVGADQGHYRGYTQANLEALIDKLSHIKGSFLLSGYDNPAIPSHWPKLTFDVLMTANTKSSRKRERTECLWRVVSPWAAEQMRARGQLSLELGA